MSLKQKMVGVVALVAMAAGGFSLPVGAIKCEAGSVRGEVEVANAADCNVENKGNKDTATAVVNTVVDVLVALAGIIALVAIIYGGAQIMISQGDAGKVKTGRQAVIYGAVGLVVAALAWVIVNFVLTSATGS